MNILFLSDYAGLGGGETSLLNFIEALPRSQINSILLIPCEGRLAEHARQLNIQTEICVLSRWRAWFRDFALPDPKGIKKLLQIIQSHKIDLIHCNSPEASLVLGTIAAKRAKIPFVWNCHGPWERPYGRRGQYLSPFLAHVFCISKWVQEQTQLIDTQTQVLYPFINHGPKKNDIQGETFFKSLPAGCKKVALIARYQKIKGHALFLQTAFQLIAKGHDDLYFILVGDAEFNQAEVKYKHTITKIINNSPHKDRFLMVGKVDNMSYFYQQLDQVVIASDAESFSMVTLEAISAGVTPVIPDTSAPLEITNGSECAYLYTTLDSKSLATAIIKANESPINAHDLIQRGRSFNSSINVKKALQIYQKLINEQVDQK